MGGGKTRSTSEKGRKKAVQSIPLSMLLERTEVPAAPYETPRFLSLSLDYPLVRYRTVAYFNS